MKKLILFFAINLICFGLYAQITTTVNPTIAQLQALLQGNGITVTNLSLTCPAGAYATFGNGASALGSPSLNSGILLTTGSAANVAGPNTSSNNLSFDNLASGSTFGNSLSGGTTYDGCYMTFQLTPTCATLSINYVFASEEYPEYSVGTINDVFGFGLTGPIPVAQGGGTYNQQNIATLPGTTTPVSIQNVNNGSSNTGPCKNCAYYIANPAGLAYDGATTVLTASASVIPCQTYTMTIGVWDDSDGILDSGVFLDVNGLSCGNQPTLSATASPSTTCGPQSVTLTAVPSSTLPSSSYTWSAPPSGGLASTSGTMVTANPTGSTTYTISYSDINTCPGFPVTQTVNVSFTPPPALPVSQTPAGTICLGQSATLTANGGAGTYSWSPGTFLSTTTNSVTVTTPTVTTTYTVTKSVGACISSTVITVNVASTSTIAITPSVSSICLGQSQALSASGSGPYSWTASSGANPPASGNVTVTPSSTTTYTVISGAGTCTAMATATVSISATPTIAITPSISSICSGQSQALSSSGGGPFVWTASSGVAPPAVGTVTVSPATTTTYTVLSGTGACTAQATAIVSVTPNSTVSITPSNTTICLGESTVLTSSGGGPFVWTASSGANPSPVASVTVNPSTNTTYTVLAGTGACTAQAVATVSISPSLTINITPSNTTICNGQSANLTCNGSAGPFVWTASSGANPPTTSNVSVNPATTTTYSVLAGTGACTAQAVATVSVSPTLTITTTPSSTNICNGTSTSINASGATSYTWLPNGTTGNSISVTPTTTITYTVIGSDAVCTNSSTATVSVTTINTTLSANSPSYCLGVPSVTLTGNGATTYSWSPGTGLNVTTGAVVTATPGISTIYTVTGTTNGCVSTQTISITVPPTNSLTATASNTTICLGGSGSTLTATSANTYTWLPTSANGSVIAVNPTSTTEYTVIGQNAQGCFANPTVVTVFVVPAVVPTISSSSATACQSQTIGLSVNPGPNYTYTWQPVAQLNSSNNTNTVNAMPTSSSNVIYTVNVSNGICSATDTILIKILTPPSNNNFTTLNNDTICVGGCVTFSATTSGSQPMSYNWYYESGVGTSSVGVHPEACYPSAGTFSVMSIAYNACGSDTTIKTNFVTVYDYPIVTVSNDTTIDIGMTANIAASGGVSYSWYTDPASSYNTITCSTCSASVVNPTMTTNYIVVASNSPYCKVRDTITVTVDINCGDFFVPNVFSPNDDGLNDDINVHGRCIETFNLQIFNRWGEKVFETNSLSNSWDGTYRGKKLDTGVFVYKADGVSIDGQTFKFKGNITLLR